MITIYTQINPTENEEKIIKKLKEAFPGCDFKIFGNKIECKTENIAVLEKLKQKIDEKKVKNTVSYLIAKNQTGNSSKIELNKQTLMIGKFYFVEENYPLGNVVIETDNAKELNDYLTT